MSEKQCFKCGEVKPLSEYYRHPRMGDGHLGKCKACTRADIAARVAVKQQDPEWSIKEARRHREKSKRKRLTGGCHRLSTEAKRVALARHKQKYPEKDRARALFAAAVRRGVVVRQPCEVCGREDTEGHHHDYSLPLDVKWLCPPHHAAEHVKTRIAAKYGSDRAPQLLQLLEF